MGEQNKSVLPERAEPTWEIEEIVSPVQPEKPSKVPKLVTFTTILIVVIVSFYSANRHYDWFGQDMLQDAPMQDRTETPRPIVVTEGPLPSVVVTESIPTPRISSISTDTPSANTQSSVTTITTKITAFRNYVDSTYGFTVQLENGLHTVTKMQNDSVVMEFLTKQNNLVFQVHIIGAFGQTLQNIKNSLLLSPEIEYVSYQFINGRELLSYQFGNVKAYAIVQNNFVYYITDYTANAISTFVLR